jgi:hypothetical protein
MEHMEWDDETNFSFHLFFLRENTVSIFRIYLQNLQNNCLFSSVHYKDPIATQHYTSSKRIEVLLCGGSI